jgi:hypothetical protein
MGRIKLRIPASWSWQGNQRLPKRFGFPLHSFTDEGPERQRSEKDSIKATDVARRRMGIAASVELFCAPF